jgi:aspartate-semialdehyde dehydrogenase
MEMKKLRVAILGATGTVGQRMIQFLDRHPWFEVGAVCASDGSKGKRYREAAHWLLETPIPDNVSGMEVGACAPGLECDFVLSTLPSPVASVVEADFARAGYAVISNASSFRMGDDVPLLVPEINSGHTAAIGKQRARWGGGGFIATNPNCSTIGLVFPRAALDRAFGLDAVHVVTMQALSGAGYPGVASLDAIDNVLPSIGGGDEDRKIETEPLKILGTWNGEAFELASFPISAMTHRVNVRDGHLEACSVRLRGKTSPEEIREVFREFRSPIDALGLPSAPSPAILVEEDASRPQPRLDRDRGNGMAVVVGPALPCAVLDYKFRVLSHNTVRGAAGAAILNAELLYREGLIG